VGVGEGSVGGLQEKCFMVGGGWRQSSVLEGDEAVVVGELVEALYLVLTAELGHF